MTLNCRIIFLLVRSRHDSLSGDFPRKLDDRNADRTHLSPALQSFYKLDKTPSDLRVNHFPAALLADSGGHALNYDESTLDPEILCDTSRFHPLAADVALAVIVHGLPNVRRV